MKRLSQHYPMLAYLVIGIVVRAAPVMQHQYPLGEGGLFDYLINYFAIYGKLPSTVPYYSCGIPFAYPPLGFVLYGSVVRLTSASSLTVLKWGALVFSCLSLIAFTYLAKCHLRGRAKEFAVLCFATLPAIVSRIGAANAIRNLALCQVLLGIALLHQALSDASEKRSPVGKAILAGLLGGLVILTHPSSGLSLLVISALYTVAGLIRNRSVALLKTTLAYAGTLVIVAAAWLIVLYQLHGTDFITILGNASGARPTKSIWLSSMLHLGQTGEPFTDLWAVVGALGLIYGLLLGNWVPALWFVVTPVHWSRQLYLIPLAIGAGWTLGNLIAPGVVKTKLGRLAPVGTLLGLVLVGYAVLGSLTFSIPSDTPLIGTLVGDQREPQITDARLDAWQWMRENLASDSRFVVIAEEKEWVPAYSHTCANISQGAEWIGKFIPQGDLYNQLMSVSSLDALIETLNHHDQPIEYLYLSVGASSRFRSEMATSGGNLDLLVQSVKQRDCANRLYENDEVAVYEIGECQ